MFDIRPGATPSSAFTFQFATLQLTPLADGQLSVCLKTTFIDEAEYELVDQEAADERVTSIEGLLDFIRRHIQLGSATPLPSYTS